MERWLPVVGFEGRYEVSDHGRVRSVDRSEIYVRKDQYSGRDLTISRILKGRLLRPGKSKSGHVTVAVGKGNSRLVHHLVLEAFVGPRPEGMEGRHRNDVPNQNDLQNLCWGTRSENLHDAVRNGKRAIGEAHHSARLTEVDVRAIRQADGPRGLIKSLAEKFGLEESAIRGIRARKTWKHVT